MEARKTLLVPAVQPHAHGVTKGYGQVTLKDCYSRVPPTFLSSLDMNYQSIPAIIFQISEVAIDFKRLKEFRKVIDFKTLRFLSDH